MPLTPPASFSNGVVRNPPSINYNKLNDAVNEIFFNGEFRLAPVYLDLEDNLLDDLGAALGVAGDVVPGILTKTVSAMLRWEGSNPFDWYVQELKAWISLDCFEAPPFTALLCVLSLSAERMRNEGNYSAGNYYERLFELLLIKDEAKKTKVEKNFNSTVQLWTTLNKWLTSNDFEYGKPTAQKVNKWPFVSYTLSQALVRDADRKCLHNLFVQFSLAPRERIADVEMGLYLHSWMSGSHASNWLKRIWSKPDLRQRVVASACAELEHWDGAELSSDKGSIAAKRALHWVGTFSTFPAPALQLYLTAPPDGGDNPIPVKLSGDVSPAAGLAFKRCTSELNFSNSPSGEFSILGPRQKIDLSSLLVSAFELSSASSKYNYKHIARAVFPLAKLSTGAYYREISRVSLLRPHIVICHEGWRDTVEKFLSQNARPGFKVYSNGTLSGLPKEWALIDRVEIVQIPEAPPRNLECLVPFSDETVLEVSGGLQLGPSSWHLEAPPDITGGGGGGGELSIELRLASFDHNAQLIATSPVTLGVCELAVKDLKLCAGNEYAAILISSGNECAEKSIRLCSADIPRKSKASRAVELAYQLGQSNPCGILSAGAYSEAGTDITVVQGMEAFPGSDVDDSTLILESLSGDLDGDPAIEDEPRGFFIGASPAVGDACVLRIFHIWHCQPFNAGDKATAPMWMKCNDCGSSKVTRSRGKKKKTQIQVRAIPTVISLGRHIPPRPEYSIDPDLLFDGVCHLNSGTWSSLQELSQVNDAERFGRRFANSLVDLGHIDAMADKRGLRPEKWVCSPPMIVQAERSLAFLAGFRSKSMVANLSAALSQQGLELEKQQQLDAPTAFVVRDASIERLREIGSKVCDPFGRAIAAVESPGATIAASCAPLSKLLGALPEIHIDNYKDLEVFDPKYSKWRPSQDANQPGAYRTSFAGRRYFFNDGSGRLKEGTYEVIKTMGAKYHKSRLHSYDDASGSFIAVLGCEPPGILKRALISCSGVLPHISQGKVFYRGVDRRLAGLILNKLYT
jgi:hypothetical protein